MVIELAYLRINPADSDAFEKAVAEAKPCFEKQDSCHGMRLGKVLEEPGRYLLQVDWDSVEAHMVTFRESADFQRWREIVGGFFTEPPQVEHISNQVFFPQ